MKFRKSKKSEENVFSLINGRATLIDNLFSLGPIGPSSPAYPSATSAFSFNYSDGLTSYSTQRYNSPNVSINMSYRTYRPSLASQASSSSSSSPSPYYYYYQPTQYPYQTYDSPLNSSTTYGSNQNSWNSGQTHHVNSNQLMLTQPVVQQENPAIEIENEDADEIKPGQASEASFEIDENDQLDFSTNNTEPSQHIQMDKNETKTGNKLIKI